jgi:dihydroxyacetone kinase-like protein
MGWNLERLVRDGRVRYAAVPLKQDECLSSASQATIVEAMTTGIKARGKGQRGDKTMLDAWIPATEAAVSARASGVGIAEMWDSILEAAETGALDPWSRLVEERLG